MKPFQTAVLTCVLVATSAVAPVDAAVVADEPVFIDMRDRRDRMVEAILEVNEESANIVMNLMLFSGDLSPTDIDIWLVTDSAKYALDVDDIGVVSLGAHAERLRELKGFEISPTSDDVRFGAKAVPRLPLTRDVNPERVMTSVDEINTLIKRAAGVLSLFAPKVKGVRVQVPKNTVAELVTHGGKALTIHANDDGWIEIPMDAAVQRIDLSTDPIRFDFYE